MKAEGLKTLQDKSTLRHTPKPRIVKTKVVKLKPKQQSIPCEKKAKETPCIDFEKVKYWAKRR